MQGFYVRIVLCPLVLLLCLRLAAAQSTPAAPKPEKRYSMTFSVNIQNLLNRTNLSQPIGNLSSDRFGESTSTVGGFGFGPGGSAAAGNRRIQLQLRFSF